MNKVFSVVVYGKQKAQDLWKSGETFATKQEANKRAARIKRESKFKDITAIFVVEKNVELSGAAKKCPKVSGRCKVAVR